MGGAEDPALLFSVHVFINNTISIRYSNMITILDFTLVECVFSVFRIRNTDPGLFGHTDPDP